MENQENQNNNDNLFNINYTYPTNDDDNLQYKIYKKREFYSHKLPERPDITKYEELKDYRDNICAGEIQLFDYQSLLANIINPDTPYKGMIVFHGLGTGKCIHPESYISIKKDNSISKYIIKDLWDTYSSNIIIDNDNGEWSEPIELLHTISYTGSHLEYKKITKLYREKFNGFIKLYKLEDGTEIRATIIHKFLTDNNIWSNTLNANNFVYKYEKNQIKPIKILSVDLIRYSGYIYDLEIDTHHNYIANDIITHNTCAGVAIAEKFKPLVQKYNTKIMILVPGALLKENWKQHLIKCTGETYLKKIEIHQN